jgi:hypothetical protein
MPCASIPATWLYRIHIKYLWESMRKGYYNNKFEVEARQAEKE